MNDVPTNLALISLGVYIYMTAWFIKSQIEKRSDLADQAWGLGFILVAILSGLIIKTNFTYFVVLGLVTIWGMRLYLHISNRQRKSKEDVRYKDLTNNGQKSWVNRYTTIYLFQGLLLLIVSSPIIASAYIGKDVNEFNLLNIVGIIVWVVGFIFESVGDHQLKIFLSNPKNKGKLMTSGLWQYTRHPNYFGEITMWWGIYLIVFNQNNLLPSLFSIIGPVTITILIVFISGIPLLEKRYQNRKDWLNYASKTSILIPWFKKR